jgi:hypothetical protein
MRSQPQDWLLNSDIHAAIFALHERIKRQALTSMPERWERAALQAIVGVAALVPVTAGALGVFWPRLIFAGPPSALIHPAYLSGLLLGIGLGFWSLIPSVERQGRNFILLTAVVVVGGLARAYAALEFGAWDVSVVLPLTMELGVTPALCLWQRRVSKIARSGPRN